MSSSITIFLGDYFRSTDSLLFRRGEISCYSFIVNTLFLSKDDWGKSSLNLKVSLALKEFCLGISRGLGIVLSILYVILSLGPNPLSSLNFKSSKALKVLLSLLKIDVFGRLCEDFCLFSISSSRRSSKSSRLSLFDVGLRATGFCSVVVAVVGLSSFLVNFLF